jgi:hypothetical protein
MKVWKGIGTYLQGDRLCLSLCVCEHPQHVPMVLVQHRTGPVVGCEHCLEPARLQANTAIVWARVTCYIEANTAIVWARVTCYIEANTAIVWARVT